MSTTTALPTLHVHHTPCSRGPYARTRVTWTPEAVVCDPTWTIARCIRFVISKLCRYSVRPDGTVRTTSARVAARAEQIAQMRYGVDARGDAVVAGGMEYPAIARTIGLSRMGAQGYVLTLAKIARRTTITMPALERLARTGAPFYRSPDDEREAQATRGAQLSQSDVARFIHEILTPAAPAAADPKSVRATEQRREHLAAAARAQVAERGAAYMPDLVTLARTHGADEAEVAALAVWFSSVEGFEWLGGAAGGWFWPGGEEPEMGLLRTVARRVLSVAQCPVPLHDLVAALNGTRRFTAGVRRSLHIEALPLLAVERIASRLPDLDVHDGTVAARVSLDASEELAWPDLQILEHALRHGGGLTMQEVRRVAGWTTAGGLHTYYLWLRTSAFFVRIGQAAVGLRYSPPDAAARERLNAQHHSRRAAKERRFAAASHDVLTCTTNLTRKVLSKPVLFLPRVWGDSLPMGNYTVSPLGIEVQCAPRSNGVPALTGLVRWLQAAGFKEGDEVPLTIHPGARRIDIGGRAIDEAYLALRHARPVGLSHGGAVRANLVERPATIAFDCHLGAYEISRRYVPVPMAVSHRLNSGAFPVRGESASITISARSKRSPVIRGLVPLLLERGFSAGARVRVVFDLVAGDVDLVSPERENARSPAGPCDVSAVLTAGHERSSSL